MSPDDNIIIELDYSAPPAAVLTPRSFSGRGTWAMYEVPIILIV